ncbi:hypothetical protein FDJ70_09815 [Clostridium botulinum]|uniref:Uncharacterized protein n=2 Tax=Clostridium botulinum TaxID=1491 RepID=C4B6A5_CLOBO|nr:MULTISPECIES: hypothetical protein [Clostridium]ACT33619.1 hypothetical protein CLG_0009 [Clostridium botulinum D str. 1873]AYF55331.1 hypothetical protein DFH04_11420 [Clostridium novyi]MBO3441477.1 hypothetical protein [Clostridium haemolyticum]MCD3217268.1 hypothetical protein [Clostridium botulinum C]MCD3246010.1 hypothetical protein [Clostridium botulinum C]
MIKTSNCCYCFNKSMDLLKFVRFTNKGFFTIQCILQYTLGGQTVTKDVILERRHTKKFVFHGNASNICLNIINLSNPDLFKRLIHHECISGLNNICFEVYNTTENPMIRRILC